MRGRYRERNTKEKGDTGRGKHKKRETGRRRQWEKETQGERDGGCILTFSFFSNTMLINVIRTDGAQEELRSSLNSGPAPYITHLMNTIMHNHPNMPMRKIICGKNSKIMLM